MTDPRNARRTGNAIWLRAALAAALVMATSPAVAQNSQSPVDITPGNTQQAPLPPLQFNYGSTVPLSVVNTGSPGEEATIRADVQPGAGMVVIDTTSYDLLQFHFHSEAEHEINSVRAPMELHLVHRSSVGELAVVGRLIEVGAANPLLDTLFSQFPQTPGTAVVLNSFNLAGLLPDDLSSFRYSGSLTTPPFSEPVRWNVLASPLFASEAQIDLFRTLFPDGNSREVQPLNGRTILTDVPGFAAAVPEPASWAMLILGFAMVGGVLRRRRPMVHA
jgi:carbonic anhydrase